MLCGGWCQHVASQRHLDLRFAAFKACWPTFRWAWAILVCPMNRLRYRPTIIMFICTLKEKSCDNCSSKILKDMVWNDFVALETAVVKWIWHFAKCCRPNRNSICGFQWNQLIKICAFTGWGILARIDGEKSSRCLPKTRMHARIDTIALFVNGEELTSTKRDCTFPDLSGRPWQANEKETWERCGYLQWVKSLVYREASIPGRPETSSFL